MIGKCNHLTSVQTLLLFHHTARLSGFPIVNCGFYMILLYSRKLFDSIISQLVINQPSFINIINDTSPMYWIGPPGPPEMACRTVLDLQRKKSRLCQGVNTSPSRMLRLCGYSFKILQECFFAVIPNGYVLFCLQKLRQITCCPTKTRLI
jgi:hypothetical protein